MLDYFLWGHVKSLIYETSVESEEDLLARVMARRVLHFQVLVIVYSSTWYVGTGCVEVTGRHLESFL